jgi:hypothetical protein
MAGQSYKRFTNSPEFIAVLANQIATNASRNAVSKLEFWLTDGTSQFGYVKSLTDKHIRLHPQIKYNPKNSKVTYLGEPLLIPYENLHMYSLLNEAPPYCKQK